MEDLFLLFASLLAGLAGRDNFPDFTLEDFRQVVPGFLDTMVGYAILWKIVSTDFFTTVASADLVLAYSGIFFRLFFLFERGELGGEDGHRLLAVGQLAAFIGRAHINASRLVDQAHGRLHLVHVLPALATRARIFHFDIRRIYFKINFFAYWQNCD